MIIYIDTSSLVKLFVYEEDSEAVRSALYDRNVATSIVAYPEARAAFGKRVRMGTRRLTVMADAYNVFNSDWVFSQNNTLGTNYTVSSSWLRPTNVLTARMFKIGAQLEF